MKYLLTILMLAIPAVAENKTIVLSENNMVALRLPITDDVASQIQLELTRKAKAGHDLYLVLNSPGGSIVAGKAIIETIKGLPVKVHTVSMFSASMSFILSQYLSKRYALDSSMLMTHRGYVEGVSGNIPGSLVSRVVGLYNETTEIDVAISNRSGMPLDAYQRHTANELWMTGQVAKQMGFVDEIVNVRCDKSLEGAGPTQRVSLGFFDIVVSFYKCPLITSPASAKANDGQDATEMYRDAIYDNFNYLKFYRNRMIFPERK